MWLAKRSKSVVAIPRKNLVSIRVYSWLDFPFEIRAIRGRLSIAITCFNKGHKPFGALHVIGVMRTQSARKRILLHIHPANESRANRQENNKQGGPVAQRQHNR